MMLANQTSSVRIKNDLDRLAEITEADRPWTRRAFSKKYNEGRSWLISAFENAGLNTAIDAGGNLIGSQSGINPELGTIMIGSHSDTVPDGGRFDGVAGVIVALEIVRSLNERNIKLRHNIAIADFLAEEVSIFGVSCIGSRALAGVMPENWLSLVSDGRNLNQAISDVGGNPNALGQPLQNDLKAFFELHIEQGPVLEAANENVGIVTSIAGITRVEVLVEGRPDHAGTTPMGMRADALAAASKIVTDIETKAIELSGSDYHFTATVGEFEITPNAANVVPGFVRMLLDLRAERSEDMNVFLGWLDQLCNKVTANITVTAKKMSENLPTPMADGLVEMLVQQAEKLDLKSRKMVSGAGHDAAFMARLCPAAMVFVPCKDGRSHTPEEWAEADDIALGAELLLQAILEFDKK